YRVPCGGSSLRSTPGARRRLRRSRIASSSSLPSWPQPAAAVRLRRAMLREKKPCIQPLAVLLGGPPPVHEDALAVDVPGGVGGEEDRHRGDVLDDADAAERRSLDHRAVVVLRLETPLVQPRHD